MNKNIYTEEQLDAMSDFELRVACASKLGYPITETVGNSIIIFNGVGQFIFNPLENYNDCMPLVTSSSIDIISYKEDGDYIVTEDIHDAIRGGDSATYRHKSLQRAIVYCYLMMWVDK